MKQKTHVAKKPKENNDIFTIKISHSEIERKVRKSLPPASQPHRNKKMYDRKTKHPKREEG